MHITPAIPVIIAIPVHNEAARLSQCLAALSIQRDATGGPIPFGAFEILVFANNCSDASVRIARSFGDRSPRRVTVFEERLPPERSNAGWARKRAMDLASIRLSEAIGPGVIMTTDADSCVSPTWFDANMTELGRGVDCVAGYIDANAEDILSLGQGFVARGHLEDAYIRQVAEIYALCDPRPHNPWPTHRVSSGASLAITRAAYVAIGGLPARPLGEDAALTACLDDAGFKVRHSMDVFVTTSCRLDGRAIGGAADTMRYRVENLNAHCDDELERAVPLTRRAINCGLLRKAWADQASVIPQRIDVSPDFVAALRSSGVSFQEAWQIINRDSTLLSSRQKIRPSDLPQEIAVADRILRRLRARFTAQKSVRGDIRRPEISPEQGHVL